MSNERATMTVYKVMAKNDNTNTSYDDSFWLREEDANARVEELKLSDAMEEPNDLPPENWRYPVFKVQINL